MYQGLTTAQAQEAVRLGLSNIGVDNTARTAGQIIRDNVLTYFNLIFAVLTVLLVLAGSYRSLTFLPVVIANTLIGIIQQLRAKDLRRLCFFFRFQLVIYIGYMRF